MEEFGAIFRREAKAREAYFEQEPLKIRKENLEMTEELGAIP
jgi:hypothetical protein